MTIGSACTSIVNGMDKQPHFTKCEIVNKSGVILSDRLHFHNITSIEDAIEILKELGIINFIYQVRRNSLYVYYNHRETTNVL